MSAKDHSTRSAGASEPTAKPRRGSGGGSSRGRKKPAREKAAAPAAAAAEPDDGEEAESEAEEPRDPAPPRAAPVPAAVSMSPPSAPGAIALPAGPVQTTAALDATSAKPLVDGDSTSKTIDSGEPEGLIAPVSLNALKGMRITELAKLAHGMNVEGAAGLKKQDLIFAILQGQKGEVQAEGALEVLPDGFGFLRSPDFSYLPGPDDIYVSPSQIRRFNLCTGDTITGHDSPAQGGGAVLRAAQGGRINFEPPEEGASDKILFDNLTPLYPNRRINLEHDTNEMTTRIIDLLTPIGKGQRCLIVAPPAGGQDGAAPEHRPRHHRQSPRGRCSSCCSSTSGPRK